MKLTCEPRIVSRQRLHGYRWIERIIVGILAAIALWLMLREPNVDLVDPPFVDQDNAHCPQGYSDPQQIDDFTFRCTLDQPGGID